VGCWRCLFVLPQSRTKRNPKSSQDIFYNIVRLGLSSKNNKRGHNLFAVLGRGGGGKVLNLQNENLLMQLSTRRQGNKKKRQYDATNSQPSESSELRKVLNWCLKWKAQPQQRIIPPMYTKTVENYRVSI
jgi:hypothetical protein